MKGPIRLSLQPITRQSFSPFGELVEMGAAAISVNEGTALRRDVGAFPAIEAPGGSTLITSVFEAKARDLPQRLGILERHANSAQLITPLGGAGHAVVVCLTGRDGMPDLASIVAFRCSANQGVVYRRGLWHHPIAALGMAAQFLVQSWQDGSDADCEIVPLGDQDVAIQPMTQGASHE